MGKETVYNMVSLGLLVERVSALKSRGFVPRVYTTEALTMKDGQLRLRWKVLFCLHWSDRPCVPCFCKPIIIINPFERGRSPKR